MLYSVSLVKQTLFVETSVYCEISSVRGIQNISKCAYYSDLLRTLLLLINLRTWYRFVVKHLIQFATEVVTEILNLSLYRAPEWVGGLSVNGLQVNTAK